MCLALATCACALTAGLASRNIAGETAVQSALEQLRAGRHAQAEQSAMALTQEQSPQSSRAWIVVAAARQQLRQYDSAQEAYKNFLATCNSGNLRQYALREIENCRQAQAKPLVIAPPSSKLNAARRAELAKIEAEIRTESSDHFVVRSHNAKLSKLLVVEAEAALSRVCKMILGSRDYPNTVEICVWTDHQDYAAHAEDAPEWSGGSYSFATKDGIVGRRIDLMQLDDRGRFNVVMLDRVLPHEMSHLVTREYFGDAPCPLFLNEGLAMLGESVVDNGRLLLAGAALAGEKKITLDDLIILKRQDRADVSVFYAESYSLLCYLHSRLDAEQFKDLLDSVKGGCTVDESLHRVLYIPQDSALMPSLSLAWQKDAMEQAQYLRALAGDLTTPGRP
jgi:hypothetical protein